MARHPVTSSSGKPLSLLSLKELEGGGRAGWLLEPSESWNWEEWAVFVEGHHF